MRPSLRSLAVLLVALAIIVALAVAAAVPSSDEGNPSSRSAGRLGTLALYTWFDRLGLGVHRVSGTYDLSNSDMLVCYDPLTPFTSSDVDATMSHLRGGGDIIIAVDNFGSIAAVQPLLTRLDAHIAGQSASGTATPAQPFDSSDRVRSVPVGPGFALVDAPPAVPLLDENGAVIATVQRVAGGGRAYLFGSTQPLSNEGLRHDDSEWLALSTLERSRGGRVAFDEVHHGEGGSAPTGAAAIFNGPAGVAAGLAVIVVIGFLTLSGRRLGRPEAGVDAVAVPSALAYVNAMASLFTRSRRLGGIAARYAEELKRYVGARTGVDAHLDDRAFVAALAASGDDRAGAVDALLEHARRLADGRPVESALFRLARDVDAFERDWA